MPSKWCFMGLQGRQWRISNISRDAASPSTWLIENAVARECCSRSRSGCRGWLELLSVQWTGHDQCSDQGTGCLSMSTGYGAST